jgi:hypothetical protein
MSIPKQMKYWLDFAGWKIHKKSSGNDYIYATSKKPQYVQNTAENIRRLRVLGHTGLIEICDGYFDRWANSVGMSLPIPKNEDEFIETMKRLMSEAEIHSGLSEDDDGVNRFGRYEKQINNFFPNHATDVSEMKKFFDLFDSMIDLDPTTEGFVDDKGNTILGLSFITFPNRRQDRVDLNVIFLGNSKIEMYTDLHLKKKNNYYRVCDIEDFPKYLTRRERKVILDGEE